ncbi:hypothetical protein RO3G_16813 [Rhizopus delemar RA 99-880]|uniref:Uncharacterized protein n=1 Tax=Rhizopus delemar (strain RA 99-880 / ATCC MYA-4621 / FGSC 9543 / NRRL 43880) TaxID=246409 RepID=I1CU91_RHIO9|nr:hypothetical protein RO3G_09190 [Rhizopus delemar RA 99-880]EIE90081.1 hypothetical protein RO3G_14792 [Rhizopus delemar RA 99-880]EIE90088.1 hypothetical protein RO3G_14799 [Rhizopus delemar RA 99-880]EIE92021.1 hypothetical protein RO3G_16732 [Rhizopus delemar RA 99-880]EIE92102.1 hypothetical protein RO3G_16813 [Rhizopus delemar RA 99-880]|eukprot:EIE84480.1 hypothetical protein RO3G_09190 [Rhizopus delemar RA 99-880]
MCENVFLSRLHIKWGAPSVSGITPFTLVIPKIGEGKAGFEPVSRERSTHTVVARGTSANPSSRTSWVQDSLSASSHISDQQTLAYKDFSFPWSGG